MDGVTQQTDHLANITEGYKEFLVSEFQENLLEVLKDLFSKYPKSDLFLSSKDGKIFLYVKKVNLKDLRQRVISLSNQFPSYENTLKGLVDKIESVRSYGIRGGKRVLVGYDKERKVKNRLSKEQTRGKYFYVVGNNFSNVNNRLPEEFKNKIILGDSEDVLKGIPDNCVDLVFTSPPYNFGLEYESHKDDIDWKEYFDKLYRIFKECIRVVKFGGRIVVNVQPLFSDYIPLHHLISNFFMENKLIWKGEIIWEKHNYNCKYTAWGSWKSPSSPYLKYSWEFLEIFSKGSLVHRKKDGISDITEDEFKKWVYARWDIPPERNMQKYGHPAMFPEELATRVIKLFTFKGDVVLDPFNGVGTTTVVAKKLGRIYIGIDVSEEYCRKAEERIRNSENTLF